MGVCGASKGYIVSLTHTRRTHCMKQTCNGDHGEDGCDDGGDCGGDNGGGGGGDGGRGDDGGGGDGDDGGDDGDNSG